MKFTYPPSAEPLSGYTIQRGIHRGGFGEVYFANSAGGKEVALKLLHQEDRDVEIRGVTQCMNLKHPNLVNLFDLKTDDQGDQWVVMEYVSGSSLEDVLASFPAGLPINEIREWLSGLVAGVAHLHERGIVHRDLKPANVYRENGLVKVGDVGLSKRLGSEGRRQHTQSVGTVYYMAPEVAKGQYGPEVDVYSLGVMLYEMITGKLPFDGETTAEILMKHLTAQPDLSLIPPAIRPVLARALEKDPAKRTPGVRQLEREFASAIGSSTISEQPMTSPGSSALPPLPPPSNRLNLGQPEVQFQAGHQRDRVLRGEVTAEPNDSVVKRFLIFCLFVMWYLPVIGLVVNTRLWSWRHVFIAFALSTLPIALYLVYRKLAARRRERELPNNLAAPTDPATEVRIALEAATRVRSNTPAPTTPSQIVHELTKSFGLAAVTSSLLSTAVYWVLKENSSRLMNTTELTTLFMTTSIIGAWIMLLTNSLIVNSPFFQQRQWLTRMAAGAVIGLCAFQIHRFLNVEFPDALTSFPSDSLITAIGKHPLVEMNRNPTQAGYVAFFSLLLWIRNWPRATDPLRYKRFRIRSTAFAVFLGLLAASIFRFPHWYAMLWAGTIATTVQFASIWTPQPDLRSGGNQWA